jgi:FSR family fosmidomycin resistance protein-like MFS transporter
MLFYPASGAFVSLSQAVLMDLQPRRREQNMARWTFFGSMGVAAGPLALGAAAGLSAGWRGVFLASAVIAVGLLAWTWLKLPKEAPPRAPRPSPQRVPRPLAKPRSTFRHGVRNAWKALKKRDVLRWLVLLQFSDLLLDVLYGFLALYFTDVVGIADADAAFAITVWAVIGLFGDLLAIPLLERVNGLAYLRLSAAAMVVLFPAFLLVGWLPGKLILLGVLGLLKSGWYAVLTARLYASRPGKSGTALALGNIAGFPGSLLPLLLSAIAELAGLRAAMWLLLAGPIALLIGVPWRRARNGGFSSRR